MREVWLRPNRRAIYAGMVFATAQPLIGVILILLTDDFWLHGAGWILVALGALIIGLLAWQSRQPRVGYVPGYLLLYLRPGAPIRLPIDAVEACFLGSGPLKLTDASESSLRTANLVFRIADKATDWTSAPIKPALGQWVDGYVTIHGAWCERLTLDVVRRINVRLHEAQRELHAAGRAGAESTSAPASEN